MRYASKNPLVLLLEEALYLNQTQWQPTKAWSKLTRVVQLMEGVGVGPEDETVEDDTDDEWGGYSFSYYPKRDKSPKPDRATGRKQWQQQRDWFLYKENR